LVKKEDLEQLQQLCFEVETTDQSEKDI